MNKKRNWWQRPLHYVDNYLPWYAIAWRLITLPLLLLATALLWLAVAVGYGPREANLTTRRVWQ